MSTDLHTLSGVYAIDALSTAEADAFADHLDHCSACRDEVRELQAAAATMGASEAFTPPAALRSRVLAAADREPQLPPKVVSLDRARSRRWTSRIVGAAAAVVLVIAAGIGVSQLHGSQGPSMADASVSQVFHASDAHTATVKTPNGDIRVAVSRKTGRMAVATASLHALTAHQVYQLWEIRDGHATSVGLLRDLRSGKVMLLPTTGTTVAITVEPAGGSKRPTQSPIVEMDPTTV